MRGLRLGGYHTKNQMKVFFEVADHGWALLSTLGAIFEVESRFGR
jgi:hypothetical protein